MLVLIAFLPIMTNEQEIALHSFEALVRQLMAAYKEEKQRADQISDQLTACQELLQSTQQEVARLKEAYDVLKTARMIEVSGADVKEARSKLAHLIREVNKCIALLDV